MRCSYTAVFPTTDTVSLAHVFHSEVFSQRNPIHGTTGHGSAPPDQSTSYDAQVDELLDEALDETFPASDPVAVTPAPRRRRFDPDRKRA